MTLDLTKYEGHTPGRWKMVTCGLIRQDKEPPAEGICRVIWEENGSGGPPEIEAVKNAALIADAPLLLDEVVRLRAAIARIIAAYDADEILGLDVAINAAEELVK